MEAAAEKEGGGSELEILANSACVILMWYAEMQCPTQKAWGTRSLSRNQNPLSPLFTLHSFNNRVKLWSLLNINTNFKYYIYCSIEKKLGYWVLRKHQFLPRSLSISITCRNDGGRCYRYHIDVGRNLNLVC